MPPTAFLIVPARSSRDVRDVATLLREYAATLPVDLAYQGFEEEVMGLPGAYAAPSGALLIARDTAGHGLGCVAVRAIARPDYCEMKRLFVSPLARGLGLGRALMDAIVSQATRLGYREMRLDTLPTMTTAIAMYRRAGFREVDAYYTPAPEGTLFMTRPLP